MSDTGYREIDVADDTIRIVQLTDTHLKAARGGTLLGLDTDYSLQAVIDLVNSERPQPDLLLGTGDLADSGAGDAYARLIDYFNQVTPMHFWLPGNHDLRDVMQGVAGRAHMPREIRVGRWQILMLDSQRPGEVGGHLGEAEHARLQAGLEAAGRGGLHTLICMHHQPVPIGCAWLDDQMIDDASGFFDIVSRFPGAKAVLWGHVHQELDQYHGGLRLLCSPSTCVQFLPGQTDFAVDLQPPGYRWLELEPDGSLRTGVSRAESGVFEVDQTSTGYL